VKKYNGDGEEVVSPARKQKGRGVDALALSLCERALSIRVRCRFEFASAADFSFVPEAAAVALC
jgi:hypothetical protein